MELRQLEFVIAVSETLNFRKAAEALQVGQPAVSQQVQRLERELGVRLFDRTSRAVTLTATGARFIEDARAVLVAVDRARSGVQDTHRRSRTLRIGTSSGLGDHLTRIVDVLATTAPDIIVELHGLTTRARIDQVRSGRLDAAFVRGQVIAQDLEVVPVWDDPLVAALPAWHPLAVADLFPLVSLRDLPLRLVARSVNQPLVDLVVGACAAAGFEPDRLPTAGQIADTLVTVAAGPPSWAVLYAAHANGLRNDRIAFRGFTPPLVMPTVCVVSPEANSALLAPFLDACTSNHPG